MGSDQFSIDCLISPYDQGILVPFVGSGMSMPTCLSWTGLVNTLEKAARIDISGAANSSSELIARAQRATAVLRRGGKNLSATIASELYSGTDIPDKTKLLASLHWPLLCTTNYDDLYCRAVTGPVVEATLHSGRRPQVFGRDMGSCRRVLEQLTFPVGEVVWALQGFISPANIEFKNLLSIANPRLDALDEELVVGHSEYRTATHRSPHFRRTFAHLFRTRSLLFLGSGLGEPYFLGLFDEVIELTGPPEHPHYALLPEGSADTSFLRSQYHILCNTYDTVNEASESAHVAVDEFIQRLSTALHSSRSRTTGWSFRLDVPEELSAQHGQAQFEIVTAPLPQLKFLNDDEAIAISCGRGNLDDEESRGRPLFSRSTATSIGLTTLDFLWENDFVVALRGHAHTFGVVARELVVQSGESDSSRDRRSLLAIATAFQSFLNVALSQNYDTVHVQLLAAGRRKVFPAWVSLVQMAHAFGVWSREHVHSQLKVRVYVYDPSVLGLLRAGKLDLSSELEGSPISITAEILGLTSYRERQFIVADRHETLGGVARRLGIDDFPCVWTRPSFRLNAPVTRLDEIETEPIVEHLISGSTLVFDYRLS